MRRITYSIIVLIIFNLTNIYSQTNFKVLDSVPKTFIEKYKRQNNNYNPLNVGNFWQYYADDGPYNVYIVKDTTVNNKTYFKKIDFKFYKESGDIKHFFTWERNDTLKASSYMLDWEDLDEDGLTDDELLLDSLEIPNYKKYLSYKDTWKYHYTFNYPSTALIVDSSWIVIFGDTVMSRYVQYVDHFYEERIADKYGVVLKQFELAWPLILTGAIIDSVQYGTIVSIGDVNNANHPEYLRLLNNYPNPFNSSTTIIFQLTRSALVNVTIYDSAGKKVIVLMNEFKTPETYKIKFTPLNLSSGIYYFRIKTNKKSISKKMLYVK